MPVGEDVSRQTSPQDVQRDEDNHPVPGSSASVTTARQFRPILPRPSTTVASTTSLHSRQLPFLPPRPNTCGIPQCTRSPCELTTHHQYAKALRRARRASLASPTTHPSPLSGSGISSRRPSTQPSIRSTPAPEMQLEILPDLPCQKPYPADYHQIFDFFVNYFFDKVTLVFRPPMKADFKKKHVQEMLSNELMATVGLAHSKIFMMLQTNQRTADTVSTLMYSRLAQILHNKLDDVQDIDIDDMIMCVVALANFDLLQARPETLVTHQRAIQHLVSTRGGVHNLGRSLPYIVQTDRRLAVLTGTHPMFSPPVIRSPELPHRPLCKYGAAFNAEQLSQRSQRLGQDVLRFCEDECHLVDLFERSKICFDMDAPSHGEKSMIPYFFFSRDQVSAEFAHLHAKYRGGKGKNWCVLMATKIVELPIVNGGLMPMLTEFIGTNLTMWLKEELQDGYPRGWQGDEGMFTWMLWALVTVEVIWNGKDWVERILAKRLQRTYVVSGPREETSKAKGKGKQKEGSLIWREGWREQQWEENKRWMWSEEHLRVRFDAYCERVEAMS